MPTLEYSRELDTAERRLLEMLGSSKNPQDLAQALLVLEVRKMNSYLGRITDALDHTDCFHTSSTDIEG